MEEKAIKGYYRSSKTRNSANGEPTEVLFGLYFPSEGSLGEISVKWEELGKGEYVAILECFNDSWSIFNSFSDVIQRMGDDEFSMVTEDEFCSLLDSYGVTDLTAYEIAEKEEKEFVTIKVAKNKAKRLGLI